ILAYNEFSEAGVQVQLRAVDPVAVREEVYRTIRPGVIADFGLAWGRYQSLKSHVGPRRRAARSTSVQKLLPEVGRWIEPMPVLL
ncbi:MAG TPA: hypothetical protein VFD73_18735, partial [Gemmatimonadales bacterium]|nr:hypothetical protein [Gemmatimonadales bacterium]